MSWMVTNSPKNKPILLCPGKLIAGGPTLRETVWDKTRKYGDRI